jgi:two-component system chemotaxis response regulator CheB
VTSSLQDAGAPVEPARPVSAVVVAGTHVRLARLGSLLESAGITVLGVAKTVDEAVDLVGDRSPDTVLLDLALAAGGLEVVERVMARCATPIVLTGAAAENAAEALSAGAVDCIAPGTEGLGPSVYSRALARHLGVASRVRVITHPRGRLRERGLAAGGPRVSLGGSAAAAAPVPTVAPPVSAAAAPTPTTAPAPAPAAPSATSGLSARRTPLICIGASTGGPPALAAILGALPADLQVPVLVVQHMAEGFVEGLARWLDGVVPLPVSVALNGDRLRPGHVVLAPSDGNLVVEPGLRVRIDEPRAGQFHIPEIDTSFASVAEVCRDRAVGVLLTGMGRDGAAGMLAMRRVGAFTIGQDEGTSAVWGMPAAAASLDALAVELPLPEIAAGIVDAVSRLLVPEAV